MGRRRRLSRSARSVPGARSAPVDEARGPRGSCRPLARLHARGGWRRAVCATARGSPVRRVLDRPADPRARLVPERSSATHGRCARLPSECCGPSSGRLRRVRRATPCPSLTLNGEIDANRYPAFARLARDGVWYPNATTVDDYTFRSVPAMLTGRLPRIGASPVGAEHPKPLHVARRHLLAQGSRIGCDSALRGGRMPATGRVGRPQAREYVRGRSWRLLGPGGAQLGVALHACRRLRHRHGAAVVGNPRRVRQAAP